MKLIFKPPMVSVLLSLVSSAIAPAQQSSEAKAESVSSADLEGLRTMAEASGPDARFRPAGDDWAGSPAERHRAAAKLGYYKAPFSSGERPERASGGGNGKSDSGRPSRSGENSGGESAGGGNAEGRNAGGGNSGGGNSGGRNSGAGTSGDRDNADSNGGGGTSGARSGGDRESGASGEGGNGRGNNGRRE